MSLAVRTDPVGHGRQRFALPKASAVLSSDDEDHMNPEGHSDDDDDDGKTGVNSGRGSTHGAAQAQPPVRSNKRTRIRGTGNEEEDDDDDDEEDFSDEDEEEDQDDKNNTDDEDEQAVLAAIGGKGNSNNNKRSKKNNSKKRKRAGASAHSTNILEDAGQFDDYFHSHNSRKGRGGNKTSDQTLASLNLPDATTALNIAARDPKRHVRERGILMQHWVEKIPRWCFQLRHGFNILLNGFGSKRAVLDSFGYYINTTDNEHSGAMLTVNGYSPSCSVREIINTILNKVLLGRRCSATNLIERAQFVAAQFSGSARRKGDNDSTTTVNQYNKNMELSNDDATKNNRLRIPRRLYILLHNIDGPSLRSEDSQEALSYLASTSRIHLIATTDHLNTMFLWHQRLMHRFNWLWNNTTTYEHYDAETEYESLTAGGSNATQAQGTKNVLHSLTPNHRGILKLLAQYLLHEKKGKSSGMDFYDFLTRCQADMLAHNDQVLRNHLTELLDHGLVGKRKSKNGQTLYYIPLAEEVIRQVILEEAAESP